MSSSPIPRIEATGVRLARALRCGWRCRAPRFRESRLRGCRCAVVEVASKLCVGVRLASGFGSRAAVSSSPIPRIEATGVLVRGGCGSLKTLFWGAVGSGVASRAAMLSSPILRIEATGCWCAVVEVASKLGFGVRLVRALRRGRRCRAPRFRESRLRGCWCAVVVVASKLCFGVRLVRALGRGRRCRAPRFFESRLRGCRFTS
jgi:hypothetical protein